MIIDKKWNIYVKEGKLSIPAREDMDLYLKMLPDGDYIIRVAKKKKERSEEQNKYYWGVVLKTISDATGEDEMDLHYEFRRRFLSDMTSKLAIPRSTTTLGTMEFSEYIEKIARLVSEYNIVIPQAEKIY